ncbi:MAG: peptide deformylase [Verrucomicrobia bacterium]|nr:peptide deformylase [Verrucomicrobiota bacterium]
MNPHPPPPRRSFDPALEIAARQRRLQGLSLIMYPDPILRTVCQPVGRFDSTLRDLAEEMFGLMQAYAGIGLAGPQVGLDQQLLICRLEQQPIILTNPEILETGDPGDLEEGCLSLPSIRVRVRRPERIRLTGYDAAGAKKSLVASGLWARVIQHEMDHLNGVLICDHGHPLVESCRDCRLTLPPVLVEERKRRSRRTRS